jgi:beta-N-acetylhexosaminidase
VSRVEDGGLGAAIVDDAFARVWQLKQRVFGRPPAEIPNPQWIPASMTGADFAGFLSSAVARDAIQIIGGDSKRLPLDRDKLLAAILLKPFALPSDPFEQPLADALRERFRDVQYVELGPSADAAQFADAEKLARERPHVLVAMIVKPAAWHAFGLLPAQREFVERLTCEREIVLASLGVPSGLDDYPNAKLRICTYSDVPASQQALADFAVRQHK